MKFAVAQIGARRRYAVPAILEAAGTLECFYTDVCGNVGMGRMLAVGRHLPRLEPTLSRLAGRRVPSAIRAKTRTFGWPVCRHACRSLWTSPSPAEQFREHLRHDRRLGRAMARAGYGTATHIYSMLGECGPFLKEGRRRGLTVVSEVYILLSTERILAEERASFPDWEPDPPDLDAVRRTSGDEAALLNESTHFVCPSDRVRDDLVANYRVRADRTAVVPYGVGPGWFELTPRPVRGRVLFAGTAGLRKGIHYLAMAAERLRKGGSPFEVRVAGDVSRHTAEHRLCRALNFMGRLDPDRLREEFATADVFVLPSLAEGSAEVTYEALAAGIPIVVTPAAGAVARDGLEGRVVPERDPAALADAIAEIVEDRPKRQRMSIAARARARDYSWARYGERLMTTLRETCA